VFHILYLFHNYFNNPVFDLYRPKDKAEVERISNEEFSVKNIIIRLKKSKIFKISIIELKDVILNTIHIHTYITMLYK